MDSKEMKILHVIDEAGKHITIPVVNNEFKNESSNIDMSKYKFDLDWYLSHGYKLLDDIIKNIENHK